MVQRQTAIIYIVEIDREPYSGKNLLSNCLLSNSDDVMLQKPSGKLIRDFCLREMVIREN